MTVARVARADVAAILVAGLVAIAASVLAAPDMRGVLGGGLAILMLAIAVVDARRFIIPDGLVLAAVALGIAHTAVDAEASVLPALVHAAVRGATLALVFWGLGQAYIRLRGRRGIGLGDVKLAIVAGVWLDWLMAALAVDVAAVAALAVVTVGALRGQRVTGQTMVPFGCFFAPSIWIGWVLQASGLAF